MICNANLHAGETTRRTRSNTTWGPAHPFPMIGARQNWSALLSVGRQAGDRAYAQGLEAVQLLSDTSHLEVDRGADLLADIRAVFRAKSRNACQPRSY